MSPSIRIPFWYKNINFNFTNIGSVMGTVVEVFGGALINRERQNLVKLIKAFIQSEVESFICESGIIAEQEDLSSPLWLNNNYYPVMQDREFLYFLQRERDSELFRDRWRLEPESSVRFSRNI